MLSRPGTRATLHRGGDLGRSELDNHAMRGVGARCHARIEHPQQSFEVAGVCCGEERVDHCALPLPFMG